MTCTAFSSRKMEGRFHLWIILAFVYYFSQRNQVGCQIPEERGPSFSIEPPSDVTFANTKGAQVVCAATGTPNPTVQWVLADGSPAFPIQDLRELDINNGILILKPFLAEQYRPDVHSVTYRCSVNNSVGTIVSNDVQVRGVVLQPYDVQVYDSFAIEGNTAVFKCQIPAVLAGFITVSAWIKNDNLLIQSMGSQVSSEKYMVTPTGELHIAEVAVSESGSQYKCKTTHKLVNESVISKSSGRLYVNVPHGNVPTKMIDLHSTVDVLAGEFALISCVAHGFPVPSIEWYRKHPNGRILKIGESARYKFTKSSLAINAVEDSDEGSYVCEASSETGKDQAEIYLHINKALTVQIQPNHAVVKAKQSISFQCEVNGDPPKTFTWLHNGQRISQQTESVLVIPNVETSDRGMYQCMVEKSKHRAQAIAELRLSDISPQLVTVFEEAIMQPGGKVILECSASGMPLPDISWDIDGINVSRNSNGPKVLSIIKDGIATSSLTIESAKVEDGGLYTCSAGNPGGNAHHSARVNIFGSVKSRNVPNKVAVADSSAFLNCPYYGYPVNTITWHKDNEHLPSSRKQRIFKNGTLVISKVQKSTDAGMYECSLGETGMRSKLGLDIIVAPKIVPFWFQEELLREGMRARLQCVVSEGDLPLTITWMKDGKPLSQQLSTDQTINVRVLDDFSSILTVSSINPRHNGNYTCVASNMAASVSHTAQLAVNVAPKIVPFSFQDVHYEGSTARLVCGLLEGDLPVQFFWLKNDLPIDTSLGRADTSISIHDIEGVSSILTIKNIEAEHAGNYTCVAKNRVASAKRASALVVNVAPKIAPFSFQGEHLFEGALARITCVVYQGDLPLTMEWLKDGVQVVANVAGAEVRQIDEYTSILTIDHVSLEHAGNYTCTAKNRAEATSHSAVLSVNVPPKIVPFTFQDDHMLKGNLARVSCVISRGDLPLNIRWEKDGEAIPVNLGVDIRSFDEYSSILTIESIAEKHNGHYSCIASNAAGKANFSAEMFVKVPPQWVLKPENGAVVAGADTISHCKSQGYPKPTTTWMFAQDIESLPMEINSNNKYNLFPNGSLLIHNIDAAHAGYYFCEVSNGIGSDLSKMVKISIHAPPKCNNELFDMLTAVGQEYQLKCICEGDNPMSISWTKDGALISNSTSLSQYKIMNTNLSNGFSSILYILNTSRLSRGSYTCSVVNAHGKSSTSYNLRILEKPEPPTDIKLNVPGSRTIELSWQKPSDGNDPIKKYIIEYITELEKWDQAERVETESGDILTGIISNLQPDTNYLFRMVAENRQGKSKMSPVIKGTTAAEPPSGVPTNIHIATNSDNMLTVTWNSPRRSAQHERITGYNIGYKEEGSQEPFLFKSLLTTESHLTTHSIHIPNLKKFAKYAIVVQAYNDEGKGPLSEPIVAMTSEGVPNSVPKDFRCTTLTSQRIHLAWGPVPAENINGILKGYKIFCKAANGWYENEAIINVNATNTSATIGDLEKYTNYSFQISANTKAGEGPFSEPIFCRTLDDVPEAPADIKALVTSETSILISWRHPSRPNGIIRSFTVYYSEAEKRNDVTRNTLPAKTTQLEIPGLLKGHRYEFWVTATTMVGEGKTSTIVAQSPSASVAARIVPFDEKVVIPWKSDVSLSCQAVGKPAPERMWYHGDVVLHDSSQLQISLDGSLTIKSISEKDSGDFYCVASNYLNEDRVTYTVIVLVPPSPPTVEVLHTSFSSIEVKWKMTNSGSDKILGYILHVRQEFNNWEEISLDPDVSSYRLNGLECGANYEIAMAAYNKIGLGDKSQPILVPTNGSAPGSPSKDDLIEETATSISINLNAWKVNGCPIQYFVVEYRVKGTGDWISVFTNVKPEQGRLVVRDLTPATWYGLRLTAHSSAGSSIAEYNFATVTLNGATISPDEMLQDQSNGSNVSGTFNIWIVVTIILSVLLLLGGVTFVCLYVQRKNGHMEGSRSNQDPRPSSLSTDSRHRSLVDTFSYAQHNTLGRPRTEFGTMSSAGYQSDPVPYATCQLGNTNFGTLPHHHICPPVPPRNLEHFGSLELQHGIMLPNGGFMPASDGISEATFIFPKVESVLPNRYPHEDLSK